MKKFFFVLVALITMLSIHAETVVVLDDLTASYQAHTGDVLTGKLQRNVQITIGGKTYNALGGLVH